MLKKFSMFLALGTALSVSSALASTVTLSIAQDGTVLDTASSVTGQVSIGPATLGVFNISQALGIGSPNLASPGINLETLDIATGPLAASHTLTVTLTQTGLTSPLTSIPVLNAYTGILSGVTTAVMTTYVDPTNSGATTAGDQVGTWAFTGPTVSYSKDVSGTATVSSLFSETEVITAVFAVGGPDTLNANALMSSPSSVPEPASLALLGVGLTGLSLLRRRSHKN